MMNAESGTEIDIAQAQAFLADYYAGESPTVEAVGQGAWSRCYGFSWDTEELVIRFGYHVADFQKDERAFVYAGPALPIPEVLDIGRAFDGYYAISRRVHGVPLESLNGDEWLAVVPSVVGVLEAMRTADLSATRGVGGWGSDGVAPCADWSQHLLAVANDTPDRRTYGWRERLSTNREGEATFTWGYDLLKAVVDESVSRSLVHADLISRNVLVAQDGISGVFDWGCSIYGDHLYDLAWFEFWAPWYSELDMGYLRSELESRWRRVGYAPVNRAARLAACYLHIGLDHLAYNAYLGDWPMLSATAERMRALVAEVDVV